MAVSGFIEFQNYTAFEKRQSLQSFLGRTCSEKYSCMTMQREKIATRKKSNMKIVQHGKKATWKSVTWKSYILNWGTSWNYLDLAGNELEPFERAGTTWNHLERDDSAMNWHKKREFHRKKLCVQYHCPIEYNISNSCHKEHHISDVCRWNHLERNGTSNELTQIKTL